MEEIVIAKIIFLIFTTGTLVFAHPGTDGHHHNSDGSHSETK